MKKGGAKKGNIPWNKGKKGAQVAWNKGKKFVHSGSFKKGHNNGMAGRTHTEETKQKIGEAHSGRKITWGKKISEARKGKCLGNSNPSWKGGKSFEEYPREWKDTLKESIKERDMYMCKDCSTNEDLVVHHIDENKKNCNPNNLVTMCRSCHSIHHNQKRKGFVDKRPEFFATLLEIAKKDKDIILILGDLGYPFSKQFEEELPDQIMNGGICEQNLVGVAAGLARTGKKPFVYSGAMFLCTRALEQIRHVCYHNLDVTFVGTGAAGFLGFSHNFEGEENYLDLIKNLPNLIITENPKDMQFQTGPLFIKL